MGGGSDRGIEAPRLLYFSNPHFRSRQRVVSRSSLPTFSCDRPDFWQISRDVKNKRLFFTSIDYLKEI
jgi:hypothetical protein